ncbi:hypothetical protein BDY17DRAFT_331947, partial [Neohortaea acidophila]
QASTLFHHHHHLHHSFLPSSRQEKDQSRRNQSNSEQTAAKMCIPTYRGSFPAFIMAIMINLFAPIADEDDVPFLRVLRIWVPRTIDPPPPVSLLEGVQTGNGPAVEQMALLNIIILLFAFVLFFFLGYAWGRAAETCPLEHSSSSSSDLGASPAARPRAASLPSLLLAGPRTPITTTTTSDPARAEIGHGTELSLILSVEIPVSRGLPSPARRSPSPPASPCPVRGSASDAAAELLLPSPALSAPAEEISQPAAASPSVAAPAESPVLATPAALAVPTDDDDDKDAAGEAGAPAKKSRKQAQRGMEKARDWQYAITHADEIMERSSEGLSKNQKLRHARQKRMVQIHRAGGTVENAD